MKPRKKFCDGCGEQRYIWKNVTEQSLRKRYCKNCWSRQDYLQQKPSADKKPLAKRSPIKKRSAKRKKQEAKYLKIRMDFMLKHPHCQAGIPGRCTHHSTDVHHKAGRVGDLLTDERYFLSVCRSCHTWIELNPLEAKELGYSESRNI